MKPKYMIFAPLIFLASCDDLPATKQAKYKYTINTWTSYAYTDEYSINDGVISIVDKKGRRRKSNVWSVKENN